MDRKKDVIVTLADANFIDQAKQLFASVYFKSGWQGDYLLLASNISAPDLAWFRGKGIIVYECSLLSDVPVGIKSYPPVVLSKFYLFKEYFKQWRKIIFLDSDIIVQSPITSLLNLTGFNAPEATTLRLKNEFVNNLKPDFKKKYKLTSRAFNTGVLVFETDLINSQTFDEILSLYHQFQDLALFNEESILNLYFYRRWQMLPVIYNAVPWYLDDIYGLRANKFTAVIIHFICYFVKPWQPESPYYQEWADNLAAAEKIDLARSVVASYSWSPDYLKSHLRFLKFKKIICALKLDRHLGRLGLLLKKTVPQLYQLFNSIKNDPTK